MAGQDQGAEGDKSGQGKRLDGKDARSAKDSCRKNLRARPRGDILLAIAQPLRRRILRRLIERGEPGSPTQLAEELERPLGEVTYHVRVLWRLGGLSTADEQHVRDVVDHSYMSTIEDDPPIETLLEETKKEDGEEE